MEFRGFLVRLNKVLRLIGLITSLLLSLGHRNEPVWDSGVGLPGFHVRERVL